MYRLYRTQFRLTTSAVHKHPDEATQNATNPAVISIYWMFKIYVYFTMKIWV